MIRVVVYDTDASQHRHLRSAVDAAMKKLGSPSHGFSRAVSPEDMVAIVRRARLGLFELIVCRIASHPGETFDALRAVREEDQEIDIVIMADSPEHARQAVEVGVSGYCLTAEGPEGLERALAPSLARAIERHGDTIGLRSDKGVGSILIDEIVFAESSRKGAVIHLSDGDTLLVRSSLQALGDKLVAKGSFIKAGSSFLVNLDNVRSIGDGAVIFSNGDSIIIPIRARKPTEGALRAHWSRIG